jgi:flagellar motor protein MotB
VSTTVLNPTNAYERLVFTPTAMDESPLQQWHLQILDETTHTVFMMWSTGPIHEIFWDGRDRSTGFIVPAGVYRTIFEAWDRAGNQSPPVFIDVSVSVTAKDVLENTLDKIFINETKLGLIARVNAVELFEKGSKKATLKAGAEQILAEAALFINAYPDIPVRLDGYAQGKENRRLSSLYAWRVYSYLVKKGNVKTSRLVVSGRGDIPLEDRQSIDLPLVRNGVEIILIGKKSR